MGTRYPPHYCALPSCGFITRNRLYCSHECHKRALRKKLPAKPRKCKRCGETKPAEDFIHKSKDGRLEARVSCKACRDATLAATEARRAEEAAKEQAKPVETLPVDKVAIPAPSLWMVEPRGLFPGVTLDMTKFNGIPGTSVNAYPFPAP